MKVAVIGSRGFDDYDLLEETLLNHDIKTIVSGGANGADKLAEEFAKKHNIEIEIHLPDWKRYGRAAGPKRNKTIVENADKIIAFWDGASKGTKSSIDIAKRLGVKIEIIQFQE
jgi:hypothetical protein